MFNILVTCRLWASKWAKKNVMIYCDNEAVVTILNSGKTRDPTLAAISRNIFMQCASYDIHLEVQHLPGKSNTVADLLSRWQETKDAEAKLSSLVPHFTNIPVLQQHVVIDDNI